MKRIGLVSVTAVIASAVTALACPKMDGAVVLQATETSAPKAYIAYDQPPVSKPFEMIVEFCDVPDGKLADMKFDAVMPAHKHGMNYSADIKDMGAQSYRVSNIVFHMPGLWEVRIDAEAAGESVSYSAEVQVE